MKALVHDSVKIIVTVVFLLAAAALAFTVSPLWMLILLIPLFGLPIAREMGVYRDADERELIDGYRGSHLAFYAVLLYVVVDLLDRLVNDVQVPPLLTTVIAIAVSVKLISGLVSEFAQRNTGLLIGGFCGGLWLVLAFLLNINPENILIQSLIGMAILALTFLAFFRPLIGGSLLVLAGLVMVVYPINMLARSYDLQSLVMALIFFSLPQLTAGILLLVSSRQMHLHKKPEEAIDEA